MGDSMGVLTVELLPMQLTFAVRPDESVLQAALRAGIGLPSACRNGTCRRCLARCVAGRVRHRIEWPGLSAEEKADGWVLPCVALAETDLRLELPQALVVAAAAAP